MEALKPGGMRESKDQPCHETLLVVKLIHEFCHLLTHPLIELTLSKEPFRALYEKYPIYAQKKQPKAEKAGKAGKTEEAEAGSTEEKKL